LPLSQNITSLPQNITSLPQNIIDVNLDSMNYREHIISELVSIAGNEKVALIVEPIGRALVDLSSDNLNKLKYVFENKYQIYYITTNFNTDYCSAEFKLYSLCHISGFTDTATKNACLVKLRVFKYDNWNGGNLIEVKEEKMFL